jgi:G:T-mismatch repair DNA endonuclease (very short patch repair protein)
MALRQDNVLLSRTNRRISSWENKVSDELSKLGVVHERSKGLRDPRTGMFCACLDFFIDGMALEVNGSYYHSDPRVYPEGPKTFTQKRNAEKYGKKVRHLKDMGIPLFEIWEFDLQKDLKGAVLSVLKEMEHEKRTNRS